MSVTLTADVEAWKPIVERLTYQVFYRQLGIVAIKAGIDVVSKCIDALSEEGKGSWEWLVENRVLVWHDVPIDHALILDIYAFGGKTREKNTVLVRQGFWKMYFIESALKVFNRSLLGRGLAKF